MDVVKGAQLLYRLHIADAILLQKAVFNLVVAVCMHQNPTLKRAISKFKDRKSELWSLYRFEDTQFVCSRRISMRLEFANLHWNSWSEFSFYGV